MEIIIITILFFYTPQLVNAARLKIARDRKHYNA